MSRVFNFSAGPAVLPESVLRTAASELLEYRDSGMSVMEMSHRSRDYEAIIQDAERLLREIMGIPEQYSVLFLQGGAHLQFAMVPLNLFRGSKKADLVHTGAWTTRAIAEAKKYGTVNIVASSEDANFSYIPKLDTKAFSPDADYFYICSNNTIEGTRFTVWPDTGPVPLVADMSSNILSEVMDVSRFGVIFAGSQKNVAPAGVTIVIIRKDLIGAAMEITPTMLDYATHAKENSLYNTPPTYTIYVAKLVFEWIMEQGGLPAIEKRNVEKANLLYDYLDESTLFKGTVPREDRSLMNIPFVTGSAALDDAFITAAAKNGLVQLKGHRSVGGMRASIYNAMPVEGVQALVEFMKRFEAENA
ncbi:MAG TPA: 3-phosphoserine/phosphohydroxythreonine transaminase [Spirochaetota bacterium]|nr:3-phosphoserine/phosphohydroxythreonine transaminase [Spirochaetota bacterium]HPI24210.1 3-phosphoserine/phosphohydroxythreonine transaminase [Spirochaetota bacterium]HPU87481.1 3-phosphoserine/phosphohydroxythreonine transaminase [Spirochaetota bacterium]